MAIYLKKNPVGIDLSIQLIQKYLYEKLGFDSIEAFGRCYKISDNDNNTIPVFFKKGNDYQAILSSQENDVVYFFIENPKTETIHQSVTSVDLIFLVNLHKVFPDSEYRNDEEFRQHVFKVLKRKMGHGQIDIVKGNDALDGFDTNLLDMQPYHFIKFKFDLKYRLNN